MMITDDPFLDAAKEVLRSNRLNHFTKPAPRLYPYQWNWDTGFISMAYALYDESKVYEEYQSLFAGQWSNGMLPQIIFHEESDAYFPGPDFWMTDRSKLVSDVNSSGITMPAVHGFVMLYLLTKTTNLDNTSRFLKYIIPHIIESHAFMYEYRDPAAEALPCIIHPWESGTDNSPLYDKSLSLINIDKDTLPEYIRKDLKYRNAASHRPDNTDYDRFVYLVDLFRTRDYNQKHIINDCPFVIQDPLFIALLNYSNEALIEICQFLNMDYSIIDEWYTATNEAMYSKLFGSRDRFAAYDFCNSEFIEGITSSSMMPALTVPLSTEETKAMFGSFENDFIRKAHPSCPTTMPSHSNYEANRYWRGPIWLNLNYLLYKVFNLHGKKEMTDRLIHDSIDLVRGNGFFEYFNASKGQNDIACGSPDFSWTAAMYIVFKNELQGNN